MNTFDGKNLNWHTGVEFYAEKAVARNAYDLFLLQREPGEKKQFAKTVEFTFVDNAEAAPFVPQPPISLREDEAQNLIDALWQAGLRPTSGEDSAAHIQSMKDHMADLRKILFKNLNIE